MIKNKSGKETPVYELGVLVKAIRERSFNPYLVIFFAGDFMDQFIKENQVLMPWALATVDIDLR